MDILVNVRPGVECPVCGNRLRFWVTYRTDGWHETLCMRCRSFERHRRTILILRRATDLYTRRLRVLHVSPDCLRREVAALPNVTYVSGDLYASGVDVTLDLAAIDFPDRSFDVILCSHVLEHIPDDRQAMSEMLRVLNPGGWALINVPSDPARSATFEDPAVVSPEDRLIHYGQADHVRVYSSQDFATRLRDAGFEVAVDPVAFTPHERKRYMLDGDVGWDHSYLCRPLDGTGNGP
jgi:SAM-dependent methyltransferase